MEVPSDRWNRNTHYHHLLLELAPAGRALDVGSGSGLLTRQLAPRCDEVVGIDPHGETVQRAEGDTPETNVTYFEGDVLTHPFQPESFDLIVSVAALHHFDAHAGLLRFAELLRPGGRLGIIGIGRSTYPRDLARDGLAWVATQAYQWRYRTQVWHHGAPMVWPPPLTDHQMAQLTGHVLPQAQFRRHLHGRHSIMWTKPPGGGRPHH